MSRGHVTGHKKERKGSSDWYKELEEAECQRVEREWAANAQQSQASE